MRWRSGIGLGIVIGIAFVAMLTIPVHSHASLPSQSSAPAASIPVAFVQTATGAQIAQSHWGGGDPAHNKESPRRASGLIQTLAAAVQVVETAGVIDGPLHWRPPPTFF
jgi:hypothetical protein